MSSKAGGLPSLKPYFLRAYYEWCCDNGFTPLILVDATKNKSKLQVPEDYVSHGQIAFSLDPEAVRNLEMENDHISFDATFNGIGEHIYVPFENINVIFAEEIQQGLPIASLPEVSGAEVKTSEEESTEEKPTGRRKTTFTEIT